MVLSAERARNEDSRYLNNKPSEKTKNENPRNKSTHDMSCMFLKHVFSRRGSHVADCFTPWINGFLDVNVKLVDVFDLVLTVNFLACS